MLCRMGLFLSKNGSYYWPERTVSSFSLLLVPANHEGFIYIGMKQYT